MICYRARFRVKCIFHEKTDKKHMKKRRKTTNLNNRFQPIKRVMIDMTVVILGVKRPNKSNGSKKKIGRQARFREKRNLILTAENNRLEPIRTD